MFLATMSLFLYTDVTGVWIAINNADFEVDEHPIPVNTYRYSNTIISNWTTYDPYHIMTQWGNMVANPSGGNTFKSSHPSEGTQCAILYHQRTHTNHEIGIFQTLPNVITPNTSYTLSVWIGNPASNVWSNHSTAPGTVNFTNMAGFPGYRVQLLAGDVIIAEDDNLLSPKDGYWKESTIAAHASITQLYIGQILSIRLMNINNASGAAVYFDSIRLKANTDTFNGFSSNNPTHNPTHNRSTVPPADEHIFHGWNGYNDSTIIVIVIVLFICYVALTLASIVYTRKRIFSRIVLEADNRKRQELNSVSRSTHCRMPSDSLYEDDIVNGFNIGSYIDIIGRVFQENEILTNGRPSVSITDVSNTETHDSHHGIKGVKNMEEIGYVKPVMDAGIDDIRDEQDGMLDTGHINVERDDDLVRGIDTMGIVLEGDSEGSITNYEGQRDDFDIL